MRECSLDIPPSGICLVSLSRNCDMQDSLYSMFSALSDLSAEAWTVGSENPVCSNARRTGNNLYVKCPERPGVAQGTFDVRAARRVVDAIRSTGCKTVYFESVHLWNCYILSHLGKGFTRITTLHDVVPHDGSKSVLLCQWLQSRLSDYIVVKSEEFVDDVVRLYGVPRERVLALRVWREWPSYEAGLGDGSFLFFGRVRKYKGLPAMERIIRECPSIRFTVIGAPDGESRLALERIKSLPNVEVVDHEVSEGEMRAAFKKASWVLLPYESASQSGVVIDAYKFGRPVIAFDVGAVRHQVEDGKSGFLIPEGDIRAFVSKVRTIAKLSDAEWGSFSRSAYEFGKSLYSARQISGYFVELFNVSERKTSDSWQTVSFGGHK